MQLRVGTFLQNRYEILELIGSGGMSYVYKAKCHKLNRPVAIKVLREEFSKDNNFVYKFKMEAQSAAGLSHPNIVNVYDVVDEEELHYIVMEYVEGITLKKYIKSRYIHDIRDAVNISIQVAKGIKSAHDANIIHRDIKPQNIIIGADGSIKVADFGIARAISEETLSTIGVGSVHYMSPEQAKGARCDKRSDIYSLGVTMYEMLTGRLPFEGDVTVSIALAHLEEKMPAPSTYNPRISKALDNIILTCTRKTPSRRYSDLSELIRDLEKLLIEDDFETEPEEDAGATKIITASELNDINSHISEHEPMDEEEDNVYYDDKDEERPKKSSAFKKSKKGKDKGKDIDRDDEAEESPGMEKLITVLGVVIALAIVTAIGFFVAMRFKIFDFSSNHTTNATQITESEKEKDGTKTKTPDIVGISEELAEKKLKENDLQLKVSGNEYSDFISKGNVISQKPIAGESISRYSSVEVVISLGSNSIDLSKLTITGIAKDKAMQLLKENGLSAELVEENSDTVALDNVIRYEPSTAKKGDPIRLYVSKGKKEELVKVPDFSGRAMKEVQGQLAGANLTLGVIKEEYHQTVAKGMVISQSLTKDTEVLKGSTIDFVVSNGVKPIETVPVKDYKYVASIDATYNIEDLIGPGSSSINVSIMVRLKQTVGGETKYTTLMEPRLVSGNTILPVRFKAIEGAYGVDQGYVEVVETGSGNVLKSYEVEFFKVE